MTTDGRRGAAGLYRYIEATFRREAADIAPRLAVTFTWKPCPTLGWVTCRDGLRVRFNQYPLRPGRFPSLGAERFFAGFLCRWAAEHLRLLAGGPFSPPGSYLEGLAQVEARHLRAAGRPLALCLPWPAAALRRDRRFRFTPLSVYCAVPALADAAARWGDLLSPEETAVLARRLAELRALADLPEIGYYDSPLPRSSLIWTLERAGELLRNSTGEDTLALAALRGRETPLCTLPQLLERTGGAAGAFCAGAALRLAALAGGDGGPISALAETAGLYRESAAALCRLCAGGESRVLTDDRIAAERVLCPLNAAVERGRIPVPGGAVHPMDAPDRDLYPPDG